MKVKLTALVLALSTMSLTFCYSVMPISAPKAEAASEASGKTVIVYYDSAVGTAAIEKFISKNNIEVLYRYTNIHGYALRLQDEKQRAALKKTKGVLSVQDDKVMQLQ